MSAKTKIFFSTAVAKWDADFYVKVDDDVHVNLGICCLNTLDIFLVFPSKVCRNNCCHVGALATTLTRHRSKPRVYIGCMKSGPVLSRK